MDAIILDKYGNYTTIKCDACEKPYLIGPLLMYPKGRVCPHCGETRGVNAMGGRVTIERIDNVVKAK